MAQISSGIVLYREKGGELEFLLVHPGGPWSQKDIGGWSIPKGEVEKEENNFSAAKREFGEEIGFIPEGDFLQLGSVTQKGGKIVHAWAVEGDCDANFVKGNNFEMEWPPKSGEIKNFPEIDKAEFFSMEMARQKINPAQIAFLEKVSEIVKSK